MRRYLEDLLLGEEVRCGAFCLSEPEIVEFARRFDPQPWHLDETLARATYFQGLCASGLHTQAAALGLVVRAIADVAVVAGGALHEARFMIPVRPDRTYSVIARWTVSRRSVRNPARGVADIEVVATDAAGVAVMHCGVTYIVATRPDSGKV